MSKRVVLLAGRRCLGESSKAVAACNDYLLLGAGRSHSGLLAFYADRIERGGPKPPSMRRATIEGWSSKFHWLDRAEQYDAEKMAEQEAMIAALLTEGLAAAHERVRLLGKLADELRDRMAKGGEETTIRDLMSVYRELRGVLDDIAQEVGGRRQTVDLSALLGVKTYIGISPDDWDDEE